MKILTHLALLFSLCIVGKAISRALPFAFPGSVIAMLLLLVLLGTKMVNPERLEPTSGFLLGNMPVFFVAPMVMILDYTDVLKGRAAAILLVCALSTMLTMAATALAVTFVLKMGKAKHD